MSRLLSLLFCFLSLTGFAFADAALVEPGKKYQAKDSLNCGKEPQADAAACLQNLIWKPAGFEVRIEQPVEKNGDLLVRFPSPVPMGDASVDLVAMEWYVARNENGAPKKAPAVVVVHESGRGMVAGRAIARGLRAQGFHTFLLHLPGYGERLAPSTVQLRQTLPAMKQAIADARRARDAAAALPLVDSSMIALQGTSLGGFVVATVSGLDHGYDRYFILLAGGQIADVILTGKQDAARMRQRLQNEGVTDEQVRQFASVIEPLRLAHRVDPKRTYLFSGQYDDVVPPSSSEAFAKAAKLTLEHHFILPVGHYSAALLFPVLMPQLAQLMTPKSEAGSKPEKPKTAEGGYTPSARQISSGSTAAP